MKQSLKLTSFLLVLFISALHANENTITNYTVENGLPTQIIYDCAQDKDGYMWFATDLGLIRYDGTEWIIPADSSLLNKFTFIEADKNGNLWAIPFTEGYNIINYTSNEWKTFRKLEVGNSKYNSLAAADISIGNQDTIIILDLGISNLYVMKNKLSAQKVNFTHDASRIQDILLQDKFLFITTFSGIQKIDLETNTVIENDLVNKFSMDENLLNLYHTSQNELYYLSKNNFGIITDNALTPIIDIQLTMLPLTSFQCFMAGVENNVFYFGSKFTAYRYNSILDDLEALSLEQGYNTNGATNCFIDYEQNAWLTTMRGISKVKYTSFNRIYQNNKVSLREVTSICRFPEGPIIAGHNNGLSLLKGVDLKPLENHLFKDKTKFNRVMKMAYSEKEDLIYILSQIKGLGVVDRKLNIRWLTNTDKYIYDYDTFSLDKDGKILLTNTQGINIFHNSRTTLLIEKLSYTMRDIKAISNSKMLVASKLGIYIYNKSNNDWKEVNVAQSVKSTNSYCIYKYDESSWLIGTKDGLVLYNGESILPFKDIEINSPVFFIKKENNYIWFGLMGGAVRWNTKTGEYYHFTTKDGLAGEETNRDAFLFTDDLVYIGTDKGLSVFSPEMNSSINYGVKPKLEILYVIDGAGNYHDLDEESFIEYEDNTITLTYRGLSFLDEKNLQYSISINNLDEETTEVIYTSEPEFTLRNLEPGIYKFGFTVKNQRGVESELISTSRITVDSPFYMENWFFLLLLTVSSTIILTIYSYVNKNRYSRQLEKDVKVRTELLKESEENIRKLTRKLLTAQEEERQRIARDLHDNIAQELAMLKLEVDKYNRGKDSADLGKIEWLSEKLISLTENIKNVAFYLHPNSLKQTGFVNAVQAMCSDFSSTTGIQIEFFSKLKSEINLSEEQETNIYRVIQESLTNIRKHSKAQSGIVIISQKNSELHLRIEDDGIGFDKSQVNTDTKQKSMGLRSMEERVLLHNGELTIKSIPGDGTKIFVTIPLNNN